MEKLLRQTYLYDFYGEFLTDHQKSVYEDVVFNDMSYSEIAKQGGVSRQGVYDLVKRVDKILEEYENKLGLVAKYIDAKDKLTGLREMVSSLKDELTDKVLLDKLSKLDEVAKDLEENF